MFRNRILTLAGVAVLAACSDASGPAASPKQISLSFAAAGASSASASRAFASVTTTAGVGVTVGDASNSLSISRVQVVLRDIELKRVGAAGCTDDDVNDDAGDDHPTAARSGFSGTVAARESESGGRAEAENEVEIEHEMEDAGHCGPKVRTGPVMVDVPVDGSVATPVTVSVPAGQYRAIRYHIAPVGAGATGDAAAFVSAHPELDGVSVRVEGTFNGQPFVYTSRVHAKVNLKFASPVSVDDGFNLTVSVNLANWFRTPQGELIDPATAGDNGANRSLVEESIRRSFHAFRDRNRDGRDDGANHDANDDHGNDGSNHG